MLLYKPCYFPCLIASWWFSLTCSLKPGSKCRRTSSPPSPISQYCYCLCCLSSLPHLSPSPLVTFHSNSCWLAKAFISWGPLAAKFSQQICQELLHSQKVLPPPTVENTMNHFPPLSLSGANATNVRTLALAFWVQEVMSETIHGNWDLQVREGHYFVRNTPLFWWLSDCCLVDNHTYFHEKHSIILLAHNVVLLNDLLYIVGKFVP